MIALVPSNLAPAAMFSPAWLPKNTSIPRASTEPLRTSTSPPGASATSAVPLLSITVSEPSPPVKASVPAPVKVFCEV